MVTDLSANGSYFSNIELFRTLRPGLPEILVGSFELLGSTYVNMANFKVPENTKAFLRIRSWVDNTSPTATVGEFGLLMRKAVGFGIQWNPGNFNSTPIGSWQELQITNSMQIIDRVPYIFDFYGRRLSGPGNVYFTNALIELHS